MGKNPANFFLFAPHFIRGLHRKIRLLVQESKPWNVVCRRSEFDGFFSLGLKQKKPQIFHLGHPLIKGFCLQENSV